MNAVPWWRTSFGEQEIECISSCINKEQISLGPITENLENQIAKSLGVPFAVATTSGSVALLMALMAVGIGPGDEVIVPNRTWIATAHAPLLLGAKVVLVDVQKELPLMDLERIKEAISTRTKVIIPVHLNGCSADMAGIHEIADAHGLLVIEDAAQALFSKNSAGFLGTQSDMGCFSLGVTKLISTGQGGLVITRNEKIYEQLKMIRNHGVSDSFQPAFSRIGCNFRITDILASMGLAQLSGISRRIEHIQSLYHKYRYEINNLPFLSLIPTEIHKDQIPLYVQALCPSRTQLIRHLNAHDIEVRAFGPNLSTAPYLKCKAEFPNSNTFAEQGLFLPCGPHQPFENIDRTIEILMKYK